MIDKECNRIVQEIYGKFKERDYLECYDVLGGKIYQPLDGNSRKLYEKWCPLFTVKEHVEKCNEVLNYQ